MKEVVISSTGFCSPPDIITNEELVASYNAYVAAHPGSGEPSSTEFIVKASGIRQRHVMSKAGIIDTQRMRPYFQERPNSEPSLMCEYAMPACREALERAHCTPADIDALVVGCSNLPRAYPALSIEIQGALGIEGFAYDLNVACSSATFAIQNAVESVRSGAARAVLVVSPEITSAHLNFCDRDSHFIFGDACTAVLVQDKKLCKVEHAFEILSTHLETKFSNNIRNNFGFLNRAEDGDPADPDKLFIQKGRQVFKEVVPLAARHITNHLHQAGDPPLRRMWLHQANQGMNDLVAKMVLGREATPEENPNILHEYANTSSCGSIIAFHHYSQDFAAGDYGMICSFGAGYSVGSVLVKRL